MIVRPEKLFPPVNNRLNSHLNICVFVTRILGLNNSPCNLSDWLILLTVTLLYCGGCCAIILYLNQLLSEHVSTILRVVEYIQLLVGLFLVLFESFNSFAAHKSIKVILSNLNEVDIKSASAVVRAPQFNCQVPIVVLQLCLYTLVIGSLLIAHVLNQHEIIHFRWSFYVIRFIPIYRIVIMVVLLTNIHIEVTYHLRSLNNLINEYVCNQRAIPSRLLHLISEMYQLAFEVCNIFNFTFGKCNLFQIAYCFISITAKIFFIFITLNNLDEATVQDMSMT